MYNLLSGLKDYFKRQEIIIDNPVFRIHCTFTTVLLITFSMIITWTQFIGQPIRCIVEGVPVHVVNTYCWIMTTFTMPESHRQVPSSVAHPGVANSFNEVNEEKHYTYYQWVCFVLFFQAALCYLPKWIWECWENGLMKTVVCGLNVGLRGKDEKEEKTSILIDYLIKHLNQHNQYAFRYFFCEAICFVNVIFQMFLMDWFFNGDFFNYGLRVLTLDDMDQEFRYDHMKFVFPRVTKCIFRKFGPSSNIETHDALCILPLNIVNEKTYIFLWFWFIFLSIFTGLIILYRMALLMLPGLRPRLLISRNRMITPKTSNLIAGNVSFGDWWVLYMLGRNVDPQIYSDVLKEFAKKYETVRSNNPKLA